ncbi:uncharacterized protein [Halyomorpha halys]|uniref:uncharacterized protein isoform X2 n=1 Tax=Halyomorpha halys TaxID=286706 RepID=UPI0034D35ECB
MMVLGGCRVVSAETKAVPHRQLIRSPISGPLEVVGVGKRHCKVQSGYLELEGANRPPMRIALRGMHLLSAGWLTFKLINDEYSLVFRAEREDDYWRWVKCLAAELLRQTPLTCLPYLDILGITGTLRRAQSEGCLSPQSNTSCLPDIVVDTCRPKFGRTDEGRVKTCTTAYMPVRERKKIWEERSRNGSAHGGSLGNLSEACKASSHLSVRQLCRMFETSSSSLPPRLSSTYLGMRISPTW